MSNSYERDTAPVDRTVVVNNGASRGGGSGWFMAGLLVIALLIGGFLLFGGSLSGLGGSGDTTVNVKVPDVNLPDVKVEVPAAPGAAPAN